METKHRLITALLLAALVASAFGRAELGADTAASVLWSPAFGIALLPAFALAWSAAPHFGRAGTAGWGLAFALVAAIALATGLALALVPGQGPALLIALPRQPLALGALCFAAAAVRVLALRRQSRK